MSESDTRPFIRGLRIALDGVRLALGSDEIRRAYLRVSLIVFALAVLITGGSSWALWTCTDPSPDASWWLVLGLWLARIIGTLAACLLGPLLAIFIVNIGFPLFNREVFMAGLREADPQRAALLEHKNAMRLSRAIGLSLWRLVKFMVLGLMLFLIGLVPVVGTIVASVGGLLLAARVVSWELLDPYFEALDIGHGEQRELINRHAPALLGFGLPIALMFAIPLVGALLFGLAQVAGAVFVARELPVDPRETT